MPILTWNGMISSSMHLPHAFCCPGRTTYCRSSKNIDASFRSSGYRGAPRLRRGVPSVGGMGAISGPPLHNRPARAGKGDAGPGLQPLADLLHGGEEPTLVDERRLFATVQEIGERRSEEHTSELQSRPHLVCRLLL